MEAADLMRTIRSLTERDSPMWRSHCPMLDGLSRALPELTTPYGTPVEPPESDLTPSDLALAAFGLFGRWVSDRIDISPESASVLLEEEEMSNELGDAATVAALAGNMRNIGSELALDSVPAIRPELTPCGVIESAHCDAIWSDRLLEFKTVQRNFGVRDLRQVLLYSTLTWLADPAMIRHVVLVNPARGEYVSLPTDDLASVVAGVSFSVLARDLADYLVALGVSG